MNENFRSIGLDTQDKIVAFISWSCQFTDDNGFIYERFRSEESRRYETSGRYYWIRENQFFISTPQKKYSIWCLKNGVKMGYYIKCLVYEILGSTEKSTF